jgi:hypothetical protein
LHKIKLKWRFALHVRPGSTVVVDDNDASLYCRLPNSGIIPRPLSFAGAPVDQRDGERVPPRLRRWWWWR